ncbi:2'-5' RNA ligase family protein [Mucilaginibacter sp.]|uniref:2'-5' RNA ligase family protein n=1 Tax=Mucilaginibacter sp. TaxID=1882438 RepID=UPI0032677020
MDVNEKTYSDYMMVISPPAEVEEMIRKYKKASARLIGDFEGMYSKAHISITNQHRQMPDMMQQKLDCYMRPINRLRPVPMYVNGFSYFTHGNTTATIYAKIELTPEVTNWFLHIKRIFGDKRKDTAPHITVAKSIPMEHFQKLWPKFIGQQYQFEFTPQSVTVLSRPMIGGHGKYWTPFKELYFNNFGY